MTTEIRFKSGGTDCAADLYRPKGLRGGRRPAIVMGHGFSLVKSTLVEQATALADAGFRRRETGSVQPHRQTAVSSAGACRD